MLSSLNNEQREAVMINDRSLLIVAGAGTGKTRVIVEKIVHLLSGDTGGGCAVPGHRILALTFTNKAADEMRERVVSRCAGREVPFIGTFHSFCVFLLREFFSEARVSARFIIFDREESRRVLRRCMKEDGGGDFTPRAMQYAIGRLKTGLADADDDDLVRAAERLLPFYTLAMEREQALDFDDLLIKVIETLQAHPSVKDAVRSRYDYIFIDEFQDTDFLQNRLISLLKGEKTRLIAVGDTDQTIYSWRGATVQNMLLFPEHYAPVSTILLARNYRSTNTILGAANAVIARNMLRQEKELLGTRGAGSAVSFIEAADDEDEAARIAGIVRQLRDDGVKCGDIAILFRANFQARALERSMILHRIPYTVLGARFFDRAEIKDLLAYLTLIQNPASREAFARAASVPRRGIGARTLERVFNGEEGALSASALGKVGALRSAIAHISGYAQTHSTADTLRELITILNYKEHLKRAFDNPGDRMNEVHELVSFSDRFSHLSGTDGIAQLLAEVALSGDQDTLRTSRHESVRLMTIHAAKGLEFPHVFIAGMEEGLFPYLHSEDGAHDEEEERRLCYVAMTRAKDGLYCSFARRRGMFGSYRSMRPSSFLFDIPGHLVVKETAGSGGNGRENFSPNTPEGCDVSDDIFSDDGDEGLEDIQW